MRVLEDVLGKWIQVVDEQCPITIENYGYDTGVIEGTTGNHCVKCVAVNQCFFKDEKNKKPEHFVTTGIDLIDMLVKGLLPGLYHFKCHCKEIPTFVFSLDEIKLIIPPAKKNYLFSAKRDWVMAMGYNEEDFESFYEILQQKTKEAYFYGNYIKQDLTKYGFKINLNVDIPGCNDKKGKTYKITSNYMIFPNCKLKMNTPIGGWQK